MSGAYVATDAPAHGNSAAAKRSAFAIGDPVVHVRTDARGGELERRLGRVVDVWGNWRVCAGEDCGKDMETTDVSCPNCGLTGRPLNAHGKRIYDIRFADGGFASVDVCWLIAPTTLHVVP